MNFAAATAAELVLAIYLANQRYDNSSSWRSVGESRLLCERKGEREREALLVVGCWLVGWLAGRMLARFAPPGS